MESKLKFSTIAPNLTRIHNYWSFKSRKNHVGIVPSEYSDTPEYPPILDNSQLARQKRRKEKWHDMISSLPTVEQKLVELNMPRYYGWWACQLDDKKFNFNGLPFLQFATRTHIANEFPASYYEDVEQEAKASVPRLKDKVEELIDLNFGAPLSRVNSDLYTRSSKANTENFLLGLNKLLIATLSPECHHLKMATVDVHPRVEAFWFLGGIVPDELIKKCRSGDACMKDRAEELIERPIQSHSNPCLGVRVSLGLPEVVSRSSELSTVAPVPVSNLDPRSYSYYYKHTHATIIPGFWPGEVNEHSQLWLHTKERIKSFGSQFEDGETKAIKQAAIISSFTQTLSYAFQLGFGPVTELTYPIVQQSAITDGQDWNFYVYQLNTSALHSDRSTVNPNNNILWPSPNKRLFDTIESGVIKGLNEETLQMIVAMYLKKGQERKNATPFLGPYKLWDHPSSYEYRQEFHQFVHHLLSNRPRKLTKPEMFLWEKFYKVDYPTRRFEPPRKFFEEGSFEKAPGKRRLDEYCPSYIPKNVRNKKLPKFKPKINSVELFKYDD